MTLKEKLAAEIPGYASDEEACLRKSRELATQHQPGLWRHADIAGR
jgi:hypothetical protein